MKRTDIRTYTQARKFASALDMSIRKTEAGDLRVAYKGAGNEASAYYTTDVQDATDTMLRMVEARSAEYDRREYDNG